MMATRLIIAVMDSVLLAGLGRRRSLVGSGRLGKHHIAGQEAHGPPKAGTGSQMQVPRKELLVGTFDSRHLPGGDRPKIITGGWEDVLPYSHYGDYTTGRK